MKRDLIERAVFETRECVMHYWTGDGGYVLSRFSKDILWLGPGTQQIIFGVDAAADKLYLSSEPNGKRYLTNEKFWCIGHDSSTCTIVGRYLLVIDNGVRNIFREPRIATFLWREEEDRLKILHMHISGSAPESRNDPVGSLSGKDGQTAENGIRAKIHEVRDVRGFVHYISEDDIEYIEAKNHDIEITVTYGAHFLTHMRLRDFRAALGDEFLQIHRSFVVNCSFISVLNRDSVTMKSGNKVPIPSKRYQEIYKMIHANKV